MGSIFIGLYRLFVRKPILFAGFVLLVAAVSIAGIKRLNITENIFAILPKGQEFQKFNSLLESKNISDQVVFSLSLTKNSNPDEYADGPDASAPGAALKKRPSAVVATRPDNRLDRPTRGSGRQLLRTRLRRPRPDGASTRSRAREVLRWLVRNSVLYPLTGAWVLTRRWWEARTNARYERQMRAAEAAGDQDRLTEWEARAERAREQRHRRRMDWITAPLQLTRVAAVLLLWLIGAQIGRAHV